MDKKVFKVGQVWLRRDGGVVTLGSVDAPGVYPISTTCNNNYTADGKYWCPEMIESAPSRVESAFDLIELVFDAPAETIDVSAASITIDVSAADTQDTTVYVQPSAPLPPVQFQRKGLEDSTQQLLRKAIAQATDDANDMTQRAESARRQAEEYEARALKASIAATELRELLGEDS